jgi:hypothetical protein
VFASLTRLFPYRHAPTKWRGRTGLGIATDVCKCAPGERARAYDTQKLNWPSLSFLYPEPVSQMPTPDGKFLVSLIVRITFWRCLHTLWGSYSFNERAFHGHGGGASLELNSIDYTVINDMP